MYAVQRPVTTSVADAPLHATASTRPSTKRMCRRRLGRPRRARRRACRRSRARRRRGPMRGAARGRRGRACGRCGSRARRRRRTPPRRRAPRAARRRARRGSGRTRRRRLRAARARCACTASPSARGDGEVVQVDAERDAAELGVVPAADARGQLREQRPVVAEQDLRRRRPVLDPERARRGRRGLDRRADLGRLELGGPAVRERHAERGRRRLLAVGDRQRHEAAVERERVDGDDRRRRRAPRRGSSRRATPRARRRQRRRASSRSRARRDAALAGAVGRLDDDREARAPRPRPRPRRAPADERARLRDAGRREPLALLQLRDGERRRLRRRPGAARPSRAAIRAASATAWSVPGRDDAVDLLRAREPLDGGLVLDRDDRAPVGVAEAGRRRVAVGGDDGQAAGPRGGEHAELRRAGAEDEQTRHGRAIVALARDGARSLVRVREAPPPADARSRACLRPPSSIGGSSCALAAAGYAGVFAASSSSRRRASASGTSSTCRSASSRSSRTSSAAPLPACFAAGALRARGRRRPACPVRRSR